MTIQPLYREIFRDCGIGILMLERGIHWIISWEDAAAASSFLGAGAGEGTGDG